eukprot:1869619-Pleurochrysis_carterae.AAC.2
MAAAARLATCCVFGVGACGRCHPCVCEILLSHATCHGSCCSGCAYDDCGILLFCCYTCDSLLRLLLRLYRIWDSGG